MKPLKTFKIPTKNCKTCFKIIKTDSLYEIINGDSCLCEQCQEKLVPKFISFTVSGVKGTAVYEYDDNIRSLLYQLKGCFDIELAPIFLNSFKKELHFKYIDYILVPAPSFYEEDNKREFNHVVEIFKSINLPFVKCVNKISQFKQATHVKRERKEIIEHFEGENLSLIKNKKVLIVDDVITTGSTLQSMIAIIRKGFPKDIKILVMAKRIPNN